MAKFRIQPEVGDLVRLVEMPQVSSHFGPPALTVGNDYEVLDIEGCCVWTTSDDPNLRERYNADRCVVVARDLDLLRRTREAAARTSEYAHNSLAAQIDAVENDTSNGQR